MTSSHPTIAMSSGIRIPECCSAFIVASASSSFAQTNASGGVGCPVTCAATSAPERSRKPTFTIGPKQEASAVGKEVLGQRPCAVEVLGRDRVTSSHGRSREQHHRGPLSQGSCRVIGDCRVGNDDAVHPA